MILSVWTVNDGSVGNDAVQAAAAMPIRMAMTRAVCIVLCIGLAACNQQSLPAWLNPPTAPTQPLNFIRELAVEHRTVFGGSATRATITLDQAVAVETPIELSTSDAAASVPSSTTVSAGANTTTFMITTGAVSGDTGVTITATLAGRPYAVTMMVWRLGENDFWYERTPGGPVVHLTSESATFSAFCSGTSITVRVNDGDLVFGAPITSKLRPGHYDNARIGASNAQPFLHLYLTPGQSVIQCDTLETVGSFSIDELQFSRNSVHRFMASFEQHCSNNGNNIRGGIRLTNVPPAVANIVGCD